MSEENIGRIRSLDGLRGLCCIPVVLVHYYGSVHMFGVSLEDMPFSSALGFFFEYGAVFVAVFFWLSGFLTANKYKKRIRGMKLSLFLRGRFRVLYPVVFFSITVGIIISCIDDIFTHSSCVGKPVDLWEIILSYSLLHNGWVEETGVMPYGSGVWYICVLLLCYVIYWIITNKNRAHNYIISLFIMFFVGWIAESRNIAFPFITSNYSSFFGGVLLYEFMDGELCHLVQTKISMLAKQAVSVVCFGILLICMVCGEFSVTIVNLILCPILVFYAVRVSWARKLLELKVFQVLGILSMSIYLSHAHVLNMANICTALFCPKLNPDSQMRFIVVMVCVFLVAVLWYYLVQKKFVGAFRRFTDRIFVGLR